MKKIVLAVAIVLSAGILTLTTREVGDTISVSVARIGIPLDKNVLGTAD